MAIAFVGIGSNIERESNIRRALGLLAARYGQVQASSVYESSSVGFKGDPFLNLVLQICAPESPTEMVGALRAVEDACGRVRDETKFGPRTLDLDLLLYDDLVLNEPGLRLPREEIECYAFVLGPLAELVGEQVHPVTGLSYGDMWRELERVGSHQLTKVYTVKHIDLEQFRG